MARRRPTTADAYAKRARKNWARAFECIESARVWKQAAATELAFGGPNAEENARHRLARMDDMLLFARSFRSSAKSYQHTARHMRRMAKMEKARGYAI